MRWLQGHPDPLFEPLMAHVRDKVHAEERFFLPRTWPTTRTTAVRRAVFDVVTASMLSGLLGFLLVPTLLAGAWALDRLWPRRWQDYDQQPGWWIDVAQRRIAPQGFAGRSFDLDDDFSLLCYGADPVIELSHRRKGPQATLTSMCPPRFWFNVGPPPQALATQELADTLAQRLQVRRAGSRYAQ